MSTGLARMQERIQELEQQVSTLETGNRNLNMIIDAQRAEIQTLETIGKAHIRNTQRLMDAIEALKFPPPTHASLQWKETDDSAAAVADAVSVKKTAPTVKHPLRTSLDGGENSA